MADDPKKRGAADRSKVAGGQAHEVAYFQKKHPGATKGQIKAAIKAVGNSRAKVSQRIKTLLDD